MRTRSATQGGMRPFLLCTLLFVPLVGFGIFACVGDEPIPGGGSGDTPDATTPDTASSTDATTADTTVPPTDGASQSDAPTDAGPGEAGPTPVSRVFVSSGKYYGDSLGGLAAADNDCQLLATAAGRGTGWKAWLSTSTTNAKDHVTLGAGNITLVDGLTVIVDHGTDLQNGLTDGGSYLKNAIDHDEHGAFVAPTIVWTGTTELGLVYAGSGPPCGDWRDGGSAAAGASNQKSRTWTSDALEPCTNSYPIYCFGP